jgi:dethiobiotin synthetase
MEYVVTGIGTDVGKTLVSAILCEALDADYWKPVQTGAPQADDSRTVAEYLGDTGRIVDGVYSFEQPLSPDAAALLAGSHIETARLSLPAHSRPLIIEGAGGVHVPLNDTHTFLDLLQVWNVPVIVVSKNYLGSINHTLLTLETLLQRDVPVAGIVFNGAPTPLSEQAIARYSKITVLGHVPEVDQPSADFVRSFAAEWREELASKLQERHPWNLAMEMEKRLFF